MPKLVLTDVWHICNKIRAAIFRGGFNLWNYYLPLDPERNCLISESKFVSVLNGPLKEMVGLADSEIAELADYFRVHDGRVLYTQFCQVIMDSIPDFAKNPPLVSGLEWEDPMHVNPLSMSEERRLQLLLTKIACLVNLRRLVLRPYFQDYELVAKNVGTVTIGHFARVLNFLGIRVSAVDFNLIVKKFIKDSYTLNYVAFVTAIDHITRYMDDKLILDVGGDVLMQYPGRAISAELPKLPRPEIGRVLASTIFGKQSIFHPALTVQAPIQDLETVVRRVQQYILSNRVRVCEFFMDFDPLNCGRVTLTQFRRGLDLIGISGFHRLFLSETEIEYLITAYRDPNDSSRVCWRTFEDDMDQVFTVQELEKIPGFELRVPPKEVVELPRKGAQTWQTVNTEMRDLCEDAVEKIKQRTKKRRVLLKPAFRDYDKHNNGHVSRSQFRQCLLSNGLLCSDEELFALEQRYNDDLGFNYTWFLKEVEPKRHEEPLYDCYVEEMKKLNNIERKRPIADRERNIVEVLAKVKGVVVRRRVRVIEFLKDFDPLNCGSMSTDNFKRGLDVCGFDLSPTEVQTIMEVFASPKRPGCVDYLRFCETAEESVVQACLERAPLLTPLQHIPSPDSDFNFLNFEERQLVSVGLCKLAAQRDMNLMPVFQDYDRPNCGTVTQEMFMKALCRRGLTELISSRELEAVMKCYGTERGTHLEVDYRAFCRGIDLLQAIAYKKPF